MADTSIKLKVEEWEGSLQNCQVGEGTITGVTKTGQVHLCAGMCQCAGEWSPECVCGHMHPMWVKKFFLMFLFIFERERENKWGKGRERKREREREGSTESEAGSRL